MRRKANPVDDENKENETELERFSWVWFSEVCPLTAKRNVAGRLFLLLINLARKQLITVDQCSGSSIGLANSYQPIKISLCWLLVLLLKCYWSVSTGQSNVAVFIPCFCWVYFVAVVRSKAVQRENVLLRTVGLDNSDRRFSHRIWWILGIGNRKKNRSTNKLDFPEKPKKIVRQPPVHSFLLQKKTIPISLATILQVSFQSWKKK